jgi:hypothetical protein
MYLELFDVHLVLDLSQQVQVEVEELPFFELVLRVKKERDDERNRNWYYEEI